MPTGQSLPFAGPSLARYVQEADRHSPGFRHEVWDTSDSDDGSQDVATGHVTAAPSDSDMADQYDFEGGSLFTDAGRDGIFHRFFRESTPRPRRLVSWRL